MTSDQYLRTFRADNFPYFLLSRVLSLPHYLLYFSLRYLNFYTYCIGMLCY
jgi:hypothetical protein